jgi:hypothetical protein
MQVELLMVFLPALYSHSLTPSTSSSSPTSALESCWWSRPSPPIDNDSGILYHDDDGFASISLKLSKHDLSCGAERWEEEAEEEGVK